MFWISLISVSVIFYSVLGESYLQKKEVSLGSLPISTAAVNPAEGTVAKGNEFSVEIIAHPGISSIQQGSRKLNNYEFYLYYDANYLDFVSVENLVEGLNVDKESATTGMIIFAASKPFDAFYLNQPTKLAKIIFLAKKEVVNSKINLNNVDMVNSLEEGGKDAKLITTTQSSTITITSSVGPCVPNCVNKQCGTDGCGNSCGSCTENKACKNNQCGCTPNCLGKECGDDGCGGSCGSCTEDFKCQQQGDTNFCASASEIVGKEEKKSGNNNTFLIILGFGLIIIALILLLYLLIWYKKKGKKASPVSKPIQPLPEEPSS